MADLPFLHSTDRTKKRLLLLVALPGGALAFLPAPIWVNVIGAALLLVAIFFASAFVWERAHPSHPE